MNENNEKDLQHINKKFPLPDRAYWDVVDNSITLRIIRNDSRHHWHTYLVFKGSGGGYEANGDEPDCTKGMWIEPPENEVFATQDEALQCVYNCFIFGGWTGY